MKISRRILLIPMLVLIILIGSEVQNNFEEKKEIVFTPPAGYTAVYLDPMTNLIFSKGQLISIYKENYSQKLSIGIWEKTDLKRTKIWVPENNVIRVLKNQNVKIAPEKTFPQLSKGEQFEIYY
ncbi:MAG: hypothetical protein H6621_01900 [Halobacteriovoraceae bacterium]|nr:hypothetical protein [Halobacteriovoraceae bacterium]MCB9093795.1 hypothetical protein [Halobacteriovoraceae bacterium]